MQLKIYGSVCVQAGGARCYQWPASEEADPSHAEDVMDFLAAAWSSRALHRELDEAGGVLYTAIGRRPSSRRGRSEIPSFGNGARRGTRWVFSTAVVTPYGIGMATPQQVFTAAQAEAELSELVLSKTFARVLEEGGYVMIAAAPPGVPHPNAAEAAMTFGGGGEGGEPPEALA